MGFLDFLRGKKEDKEEKVPLSRVIDRVKEWRKDDLKSVSGQIERIYAKITKAIKEMEEGLLVLENSALPEVETRQRQMVLGNRETYLRQARTFLKNVPEKPDYKSIGKTCEEFTNVLGKFTKSTTRNYYVAQTLLNKQLSSINKSLREMDSSFKELRSIDLARLRETDRIIEDVETVLSERKKKQSLEEEAEKLKEESEHLKKEKASLTNRLEEVRKSKEYMDARRDEKELERVEEEIEKAKSRILVLTSPLEKPLKKIQKSKLPKEAAEFVEDPLKTVLAGNLEKVRSFVENGLKAGDIVLDEKTKRKTEKRLSKIPDVGPFIKEYESLEKKRKTLEERLSSYESKDTEIENKIKEVEKRTVEKEEESARISKELKGLESLMTEKVYDIQRKLTALHTGLLIDEIAD